MSGFKRRLSIALAGLLGAAALTGALAHSEIVKLGNLIVEIDGGVKPTKLHKRKLTPIGLRAEGHIRTDDSTVPPIVKRIVIDFDRRGTLDVRGLARCNPQRIRNANAKQARKRCRRAIVGEGLAKAIIDLPDQEPFKAEGPLLAFNGPKRGKNPSIVFHAFAHVPLPTPFVTLAPITNAPGKQWGKRVNIRVPTIAGGNGVLTDVRIKVKRRWRHRGKRRSYLLAKCPTGKLRAKGFGEFIDGRRLEATIVRRCRGVR